MHHYKPKPHCTVMPFQARLCENSTKEIRVVVTVSRDDECHDPSSMRRGNTINRLLLHKCPNTRECVELIQPQTHQTNGRSINNK